jgi:DNA-binding transcriptional MerR regulator
MEAGSLTIGQLAGLTGFTQSAIRYYERRGILPQPQRRGGQRRYGEETIHRLAVLDTGKRARFSLDDVQILLEATDGGAPAHTQLRRLAEKKLPEIEALISKAQEIKSWLESAHHCACNTLGECSLFDQDPSVGGTDEERVPHA